ncbi:MAG: ATP-binding protein, partial [Marinomonas sp.]
LNQGVCIFDNNHSLIGWNSQMNGLFTSTPDTAAMGMAFSVLLDRLKHELSFEAGFEVEDFRNWANTQDLRSPISFEVARGSDQTFSVFAQEMPDKGFVISFTDVTSERAAARTLFEMNELLEQRVEDRTGELEQALTEAERANASKTRFVTAASHDLLQPLSAAKLFVSSLSDQTNPAEAKAILNKADMALSSVEQFISALLDISKLDAGQAVFDVQPLLLSGIFRPLRNELGPLAHEKGIELTILDCGLTVESDPGYLRRIIQNLVTNAIRYTDAGRVVVGVRRSGTAARIEVWDTGRGIAHTDQQTIFKEFERLSPDNSDTGLGLGLSIVVRACKGLDHPLSLWSEPDIGSCFSLSVPIHRDHCAAGAPETGPLAENLSGSLTDQLVLLVEDNPQLAQATTAMIESFGSTVIHAHTAEEALEILSEIQLVPDAMLIDQQLGDGLNGTQLIAQILRLYGPVPAAIVSAERTKTLREACKALEIDLVSKPLEKIRLKALLLALSKRAKPAG